jgi:hypothetical protein
MTKRKLYKLVIFGNLITGNEERQIEAKNQQEALEIKDMLSHGRPYFSLTELTSVARK